MGQVVAGEQPDRERHAFGASGRMEAGASELLRADFMPMVANDRRRRPNLLDCRIKTGPRVFQASGGQGLRRRFKIRATLRM